MIAASAGEERAEFVRKLFENTPAGKIARVRWTGESPFHTIADGDIIEILIGAPVRQGHIAFVLAAGLKEMDEPDSERPIGSTIARIFNVAAGRFYFTFDESLRAVTLEERNWWHSQQKWLFEPILAAPVVRVIRDGKPRELREEICCRYEAARSVVDDLVFHRPRTVDEIAVARNVAARLGRQWLRTRRRRDALRANEPKPIAWKGGL